LRVWLLRKPRCDCLGYFFFIFGFLLQFFVVIPNNYQIPSRFNLFHNVTPHASLNIKTHSWSLQELNRKPNLVLNFLKILHQIVLDLMLVLTMAFCPSSVVFKVPSFTLTVSIRSFGSFHYMGFLNRETISTISLIFFL
jgi:hypothetical protein